MAKRLFLAVLVLLFGFNAFSQLQGSGTELDPYLIEDVADFDYFKDMISDATQGKYFKQTADIDLGDRGSINRAIISTFSGTYDGGGYTISYTASFNASGNATSYALFGNVTGTVKNLNVDGDVTMSGDASDLRLSLLCGYLNSGGMIQSCNVSGNINSTVNAGFDGNAGTGMIAGRCDGTIKYCTASGSVTGPGYAGGITGQMGGIRATLGRPPIEYYEDGTIIGCSFVGSVTSTSGGWLEELIGCGAFAGGICGFATSSSKIDLCYVNADISSTVATGAGGTNNEIDLGWLLGSFPAGAPTVTNNYCQGTVNGDTIDSSTEITNSAGGTNNVYNNYYEGYPNMTPEQITNALNNAAQQAGEGNNIHFYVGGNNNVLFGQQVTKVCEAPTNLAISENAGTYTASWSEGTDNTITESKWRWTLSGGNLATDLQGTVNSLSISSPLSPSPNPYVFTVYTDCSSVQNDLLSGSASMEFNVDCPIPTELTPSNITDNGFTISWTSSVDCQVILNSGEPEVISSTNNIKTYENLLPETTYTIIVKAKCGTGYVEQASINVTTARLAAPTGLTVTTSWTGSAGDNAGSATIEWTPIEGLTYEVDTEGNTQTSPYQITGLTTGSHTAKVRTVKTIAGTNYYSNWVEMPYAISAIPAPSNPQVVYTQDGDYYDVTISWTAGTTPNNGWQIGSTEVSNPHVLQNQTPGNSTSVAIQEKVEESTLSALVVPIQVPCLPASEPTSVATTQTTAIFTFASEKQGRKIFIGSDVYNAPNTTLEITGLESGTTYSYEVREYCSNEVYSSISGTFTTVGCYTVSTLTVSDVETNSATISWQSQSSLSGLQYQIVLKKGNEVVSTDVQSTKTKTFSGLTKATNYTVEVRETCGNGWGNAQAVSFTTLGDYSTVKTGDFDQSTTWEGGNVPDGDDGNIIINPGHIITLNSKLTLSGDCKILNRGVLQITQKGELINTTDTNVGGIVEIVTPQKTINQWTFIGAPFGDNYPYPLGVIKPVSGSDISVSQFVYEGTGAGDWSDEWATITTTMEAGEGMFAWPFYTGVVTFTTYGDVCTWDETANNGAGGWKIGSYDFNTPPPATALNNDNDTVTKPLTYNNGYWMALANPYPAKLDVADFINAQGTNIQGKVWYRFNGTSWETPITGEILMTEGFFVNCSTANGNIVFSKNQLVNYPNQAKSSRTPREFVKFALVDGKKEIDLLFAHNEKSENNYDVYDANKLFSPVEIAEPYFVTNGLALVKEEVKELPYYATMNVRSYKDTVMSFVMKEIPTGLKVFIIDGKEMIEMFEGSVYTTEFLKGENIDRFKLFVRKADALDLNAQSGISITNCNRLVNVQTKEDNLYVEVYNALGQKVYSTREYNFNLNELPAGSYVVKAYNKRVNESVKIVIN